MNGEIQARRRLLLPVAVGLLLAAFVSACADSSEQPAPAESPVPEATLPGSPVRTPGSSASTPVAVDAGLWEEVREEGTVMVIVTLNIPYQPEAQLGSQREIDAQRSAIADAQGELITSLTAGHVEVNTRMTLFPQIVLTVDEPALLQLAASPLVAAIQENALSAPTGRVPEVNGGRL